MTCPLCGSDEVKVIFVGLPGRLCTNDDCNCLSGLASYAPAIECADGSGFAFMVYEGGYWRALWHWLMSGAD